MKVTIFHNVQPEHRFQGYQAGDAIVRVFEAEVPDGQDPHAVAEQMFEMGNAPEDYLSGDALDLAITYRGRRLRSLSVGDVVAVGETPLAVARCGYTLVSGPVNETLNGDHGSVPWIGQVAW